ncbi:MAG: phage head closure protein [Clostridiales bacterium]|uniref:phage head closure protein n=1 Tax=Zhenhengia sp. TaxID=2944208 RepID=UPI00290B9B62|nr:phage head closure protein [Clostridiales bacterium]
MRIGRLNKRITIQRASNYVDANGVTKTGWNDLKTIWCSMNGLSGKEYWTAKSYGAENTVEFVIRYSACKDLNAKDRIQYKGRVFNIIHVDNILYKNETLKIKAVEVN